MSRGLNICVGLLAAATVTFTALAVHFARAARQHEVAQGLPQAQRTAVPATTPGDLDRAPQPASDPVDIPVPDAPRQALARHRLEQLRDPVTRAQILGDVEATQRASWEVLAPYVGLAAADIDRLAPALAARELERRTRRLECETDPACDMREMRAAHSVSVQADRVDLLTPAQLARLENFDAARDERRAVASFSLALIPRGKPLTPAQVTALNIALVEERHRYIEATGRDPHGAEYEEGLARAAAAVLDPAQLARFRAYQAQQRLRDAAREGDSHGP